MTIDGSKSSKQYQKHKVIISGDPDSSSQVINELLLTVYFDLIGDDGQNWVKVGNTRR